MITDYNTVSDALQHIPASCDRDQWVRIGMALQDALGDAGEDLWHDWSTTAPDQYDRRAADSVWRSISHGSHSGREVTVGTLYYLAHEHGWTPPRTSRGRARRPHVARGVLLYAAHVLIVARSDVQAGRHAEWTDADRQTVREALALAVANPPPRFIPLPADLHEHRRPDPLLSVRNLVADAIEVMRHA